jgi:hypothetical protein
MKRGSLFMEKKEFIEAEQIDALLTAKQSMQQKDVTTFVASSEAKLASDVLELCAATKPSPDFVQSLDKLLSIEASQQKKRLKEGGNIIREGGLLAPPKKQFTFRLLLIGVGTLILALIAYLGLTQLKTGQAARLPAISGSSQGVIGGGELSGTEFILQTNLPIVPSSVWVYQQPTPKDLPLSEVREIAARFGFTGAIYQQKIPDQMVNSDNSPSGFRTIPTIYTLFDGQRLIKITNQGLEYTDNSIPESVWSLAPLPFSQIESIARQYLESHGLLDFSYLVVQDSDSANVVYFEVLKDQWPVINLRASVFVTPDGRIARVYYPQINLKNLARYPVHSASEAWNVLQNGSMFGRWMQVSETYPNGSTYTGPLEIWGTEYSPIQYVEITGSVVVYLPAKGENAQPRLDLGPGNPRLEVASQDLPALIDSNYRLLLLWGKIRRDDNGNLIFEVAGWKDASQVQMKNIHGIIVRQEGSVLLRQSDGKVSLLPLAPQDIPDNLSVSVTGWDTNRTQNGYPVLGWNTIETPPQPASVENPPNVIESTPRVALPSAVSPTLESTPAPAFGTVDVQITTQVPQPTILPGNQTGNSPISGKAYIDKVEFVYYVTPTDQMSRSQSASIVQPVWRFTGFTESGVKFEIIFQAVIEKYLN